MNTVIIANRVEPQGRLRTRVASFVTPKNLGRSAIVLAVLTTLALYILQNTFLYPAILSEKAAIALPLFGQSGWLIALAFLTLAVGGLLITLLAWGLADYLPKGWRKTARFIGVGAGLAQTLGCLSWLIAGPLLAATFDNPASRADAIALYQFFRPAFLIVGMVAANYMLAFWTGLISLAGFKTRRWMAIVGLLAAIGWLVGMLKSLAWMFGLNLAATDVTEFDWNGLFVIVETVGVSVWLVWLVWLGVILSRTRQPESSFTSKGAVQ